VFRLASVSKGFAGALAAIEVKEGKFGWQDPIVQSVPQFKLKTPRDTARVTIEDILSHRTGLPPFAYDNLLEAGTTPLEILNKYGGLKLSCAPGSCFGYQNTSFNMIATVIEQASGKSYTQTLRDQILAAGPAQLLAGKELDLNAFIPSTEPPADYGEPCPKTPFEMNRRFLAMALFNADPEPAICAHAKRIARCEGIDLDNPLAARGSKDTALCAAAHPAPVGIAASKALTLSRAQGARRSKGERGQTHARGPLEPSKNPIRPNSHSPARPHPHA
jgi:hypothetical protein